MTDQFVTFAVLVLFALPVIGGIIAWFAPVHRAGAVAGGSIVVASGFGLALAFPALLGTRVSGLGGLVFVDALGGLIVVIVVAVGLIAILGTPAHLEHALEDGTPSERDPARLWALMAWFVGGLLAVPLLDNLGLIWVAIEWTTVVSALLVGITRTPAAIEAAWKYLILGSVGVGFALLGTLLAYASSVDLLGETSDALAWTRLLSIAPGLDPALVRLAFVFALVGYGTKAGLAPFHTWLPDAHSQAPSPVSATLSGATLAVSLYALARFQQVAAGTLGPDLPSGLLVAVGLLSLAVAVPFIVAQGDLKRLLAYSSIEHLGICALALGFGGPLALAGLALHLLAHGLTKASLFLSAGGLVASGRSRRIARLGGGLSADPADGRAFLVGSVLLSGLPPSALFVSEIAIVFGGFQRGWGVAAGVAAVLLAAAAAGMLFHVARVVFGSPSRPPTVAGLRVRHLLAIGVPLALTVLLGIWAPAGLTDTFDRVARVLGGAGG
ncbi:MAG: proton-conducting transporter membrane subunit [Chloroflexota bacterium]